MRGESIEILYVEDNPGDVDLTLEALDEAKILNKVNVVNDGLQALEFLRNIGQYKYAKKPDIIFLDLNMPNLDGREVLREIKSDPALRKIPVVILTISKSEEDIAKSYDLHANCFITKPVDFDCFIEVVKQIQNFWFQVVKLPKVN